MEMYNVMSCQKDPKNESLSQIFKYCSGLGRKTDSMRFSSEHRAAIITETMKFKADFGERQKVKELGILRSNVRD